MSRKNILNGLLTIAGVGLLLIGYNSFIVKKDKKEDTVAGKLGSSLKLEETKSGDAEGQVAEVTNPDVQANETMTKSESTPVAESPAVETTISPAPVSAPVVVPAGAKAASTYVIKEGDTYGCIAEKYYGSFENWLDVDGANPNTEGFLERRLFVGATITLPALSAAQVKPASSLCL